VKIVGFQSGHDVSYAVLEDGIPIIHEELERFSRVKMELGDGLEFFFKRNPGLEDIQYFTLGNYGVSSLKNLWNPDTVARANSIVSRNKGSIASFGHHTSHAANVFYTSNFESALIVTIDGGGTEHDGKTTAFTVSEGRDTTINRLQTEDILKCNLGALWQVVTKEIYGLSVGFPKGDQAGTVMAMATAGQPKYANMFSELRAGELLNLVELKRIAALSEEEWFNVAASLQEYTEQRVRSELAQYLSTGKYKNVCFSGGVSLNCVMLGKLREWFPQIESIFCDPIPYDAGLSLGSARYLWHHVLKNPRIDSAINRTPYLGASYTQSDIEKACSDRYDQVKYKVVTDTDVLQLLADQKIVALFGGRSESGRRALGNRSIIADPRNHNMKSIINTKVKHRQWFRPFAPSILEEKVSEWFDTSVSSPYMSFALRFRIDKRSAVPAVVHLDGTGRLQTVTSQDNPWYYSFISNWEKLSGVPILLNTSFNDSEPIVETPVDAIACFLKTDIDYLYFYDYGILLRKECK
jgi:carbamoyltransferase